MTRLLSIFLAAVLLAGGTFFLFGNITPQGLTLAQAQAQDAADLDTSMVSEITLGNPDAPVTMIEYASFTCPHCRSFHENVFDQFKADYVDTGKVHFLYREVYFDRFGLWAAMLARCDEDKYFGITDMIYEQQREWIGDGDPAAIAGNLRRIGKAAGLTDEQLDACLSDADKAKAMVAVYQQNAQADGINSTPSFVIDGEKFSNMSYDELKQILDAKIAAAAG